MKILCMLKKKPGMSFEDFRDYYETKHAPLCEKLIPFYTDYRRNFIVPVQDYNPGHLDNALPAERPFDVVTELTFRDRAQYQQLVDALSDPKIGDIITRDEENLFDRSAMTIYIVDEHVTESVAA